MAMKEKQRYRKNMSKWNEQQKMKDHEADVSALKPVAVISMTQKSETQASNKMMLVDDAIRSQMLYSPPYVQPPSGRRHLCTKPAFGSPSSVRYHSNVNMENFVPPPSNREEDNTRGDALHPPQTTSTRSSHNEGYMDIFYSTKPYIDSFDVELEEIIQNCSLFSEFGMHEEYELSP
mmetsp:Transcript_6976/g.10196  ORF Transcript_6976/g.10196 Transcript_6976/m.10196 type:complete len:177 (-) Transcript_6976:192-722(-)